MAFERRRSEKMSDAKDEFQKVEDDLRFLKGFLEDLDRNQAERSTELDLEMQVKELIYDLQDIHHCWLIHQDAAATTARFFISKKVGTTLAREIDFIRHHRIKVVHRMIRAYRDLQLKQKPPMEANKVRSAHLNREVPPIKLKTIVGLEFEAETLINDLMQQTAELDVVSITGMPGIGKTTLAWKIYQDEKIRSEFPVRIWVDIPHDLCSKDFHLNILREFVKQGMVAHEKLLIWLDMPRVSCSKESFLDILDAFFESGRIGDCQLVNGVRACLELRKFLIVLDAVWTTDSLRSVMDLLPKRGKVLVTTCNINVTSKPPHVLRFLNEKESWDLLQLEVFGKLGECPEMLKSTGECIAKNCDGLPLAIMGVGSSLGVTSSTEAVKYFHEQWWKKVSQKVMAYVADFDQQRVFKSLELSFIKLTDRCLQDCFLYLGVFPPGHDIPVSKLIRLWIAERLTLNDMTAEQTLHDLIDRNLVVVCSKYPNGRIKTCRLHSLMYEFCKYKAAQHGFYHEILVSGGRTLDPTSFPAPNHCRLCIYSHLSEFLRNAPTRRQCVRSILCLNRESELVLHPEDSSRINKCFESVRVLECTYVNFSVFPNELSKLVLLRYISLSCDDLISIPDSISSLFYLETLVVETKSPSLEIKANIWRMFQLQHLVTKASIVLAIREKGEAGQNLQTLTRLAPACCTEDVFTRAPNLKTLGIRGPLAALSSADSLRKLEFLENLKMINEPAVAAGSQLHLDCFPPNLKRLTLSGTYLRWESMSILGKIESLEILKLKNNAFVGVSWTSTDADGFRSLVFLSIATTELISWKASEECFPSLKCLVLDKCEDLNEIPLTLAKSLDTLDVEKVGSESAVVSARLIEQEIARRQGQNKK